MLIVPQEILQKAIIRWTHGQSSQTWECRTKPKTRSKERKNTSKVNFIMHKISPKPWQKSRLSIPKKSKQTKTNLF